MYGKDKKGVMSAMNAKPAKKGSKPAKKPAGGKPPRMSRKGM